VKPIVLVVFSIFIISCSNDDNIPEQPVPEKNRFISEVPEAYMNIDLAKLEELGVTYKVNEEEVLAVRLWTRRCRPSWTNDLAAMNYAVKEFENGDRARYRLLPIFGFIEGDDIVQDSSISNPRNYDINLNRITEDHETAPCDIPEDYRIVGYVSALEPLDQN
jgi:hypothetical protein